jgi:hypothetical protein
VHAPIASASDNTAAAEVAFFFISCRHPNTASARRESSHAIKRTSRLSSRLRRTEPNALRASADPTFDRFGQMRLQLFVDLAVQTVAAKHICDA